MHCHVYIQLCRYMYGFTICSGIPVPWLAYMSRWRQLCGESESGTRCCCSASNLFYFYLCIFLFILSLPPPLCFNLQLNHTRYVPTQCYTDWSLWKMEELSKRGISGNLSRNEITLALSNLPASSLKSLWSMLFNSAKTKGLVVDSGILVNRKDTAVKPILEKLSADVCTLVDCLRHNVGVPRVLLRNGKRDRATLESSQVSTDVVMDEPTLAETPFINHRNQEHRKLYPYHLKKNLQRRWWWKKWTWWMKFDIWKQISYTKLRHCLTSRDIATCYTFYSRENLNHSADACRHSYYLSTNAYL